MPKGQKPSADGKVENQVRELIDALYEDKTMSGDEREEILRWLADDENSAIKTSVLLQRYRDMVHPGQISRRGAEMWPQLAKRLNLSYDPFGKQPAGTTPEKSGTPHRKMAQRIPLGRRMAFRVAAVMVPFLVIVAVIGLLFKQAEDQRQLVANLIAVSAAAGETQTLVLPDNSVVNLKPNTTIRYPENFTENREVELAGEAYFEVAKQRGAPFTVKTEKLNVKVTGTEFALRDYGKEGTAEITFVTGSVEVKAEKKKYSLTPSERLTVEKSTGQVHVDTAENYRNVGTWRNDMSFQGRPIKEVLDYMALRYNVTFRVESAKLSDEDIWFDFAGHVKLDEALDALSRAAGGFRYEIAGDTVFIRSKE
ncbi:FecR family protein [uncultured Alistipes sp.]|jgi:putative sigma factor regulatory protein, fecR/pupR family|uniref:FecR family protein n=1 Tax=uncultured Alistipes sp. TaxID=538949 RepID=UPI0025ECAEA2|nr:FecR family protein [uncultured Alistipes sp.]